MKKTITFDDGSVLVGSGSTFTITQENKGEVDIFDMPSQYIWVKDINYNNFRNNYNNTGIYAFQDGDKQKSVAVRILTPDKITDVKCEVIGNWKVGDYALYWTDANNEKHYEFYFEDTGIYLEDEKQVKDIFIIRDNVTITGIISTTLQTIDFNNKECTLYCDFSDQKNLTSFLNNKNVELNANYLFKNCSKLTTITDLQSIFSNKYLNSTFEGCTSLVIDLSTTTCTPRQASKLFYQCNAMQEYDLTNWDTTQCVYADNMFGDFYSNSNAVKIKFGPKCTFENCKYFTRMFCGMPKLTDCDISMFNFGKAVQLDDFFFNTKNVINPNNDYSTLGEDIVSIGCPYPGNLETDIIFNIKGENINELSGINTDHTGILTMPSDMKSLRYVQALWNSNSKNIEKIIWKNFGISKNFTKVRIDWLPTSEDNIQAFREIFSGSFDRKAAGYSICTVSLIAEQKALLTADEITAFENKGYKIA